MLYIYNITCVLQPVRLQQIHICHYATAYSRTSSNSSRMNDHLVSFTKVNSRNTIYIWDGGITYTLQSQFSLCHI